MVKDQYSRQTWLFEDSLVDLRGQSTPGDRAIVDSQPLRVPYSTMVFFLDFLLSFLLHRLTGSLLVGR